MGKKSVFLAVCAIAKNEGVYFGEWIEYHRTLGVGKFYIYDNGSSDGTRAVLEPHISAGLVEYRPFPGAKAQLKAYKDCVRRHRRDAKYIAFLDLDEFIVPVKHKTIPDYLRSLGNVSAVEINWVVYGSGGAAKREPGLVIERFRDHSLPSDPVNRPVKTIADPRRILTFFSTHTPVLWFGKRVNAAGDRIRKMWSRRPPAGQDIIRINHYMVKSEEEFYEKQLRGDALFGDARHRKSDYFRQNDKNDVRGDAIMDERVRELKKAVK
ncbi:MAG: glycosyltransferase family 92 protein [Rickettsiales bacterium]|jgi:hypothetical protein|nr:glycosyltransferase family 92 protein [Rickettsiales bacterium]